MALGMKAPAANAAPPEGPKVSFSANVKDLPPTEAAEVVQAGGLSANPADFEQNRQVDLNRDIAKKVIPKTVDNAQKPEPKPSAPPGQGGNDNPPRKLRK